jgi:hypothetical protein
METLKMTQITVVFKNLDIVIHKKNYAHFKLITLWCL